MSADARRPTLLLIAGPNGAGKTTFYETALKPKVAIPFINADVIQKNELNDVSVEASYRAAEIAAERRVDYLKRGLSFATETVFSHPSKLVLLRTARERGFRLVVFHLHMDSADLAVARVRERVVEGGHPVPEQKVRERFERNQALIHAGVLIADRAMIYDASVLNRAPLLLAEYRSGRLSVVSRQLPNWFVRLYAPDQQ